MKTNPLLAALGYDADARLVIFHADDVGMCHGSNQAFLDLTAAGMLRTGSIMEPCPWAPEILNAAQATPQLDLGVHLTLTSEWPHYRWGPLSSRQSGTGLLDPQGYFWPTVAELSAHANLLAAITEIRDQVERVRNWGVDFTHIDTHMGAALLPELTDSYIQLGFDYEVPVLLPRQIDEYMRSLKLVPQDETVWMHLVDAVESQGMPLVDWFRITPDHHPAGRDGDRAELYETLLRDLQPGVTYFSLHPNVPGDIETIVPERAYWRTFEAAYFRSERLANFLQTENIIPIGFREIRAVMRQEN